MLDIAKLLQSPSGMPDYAQAANLSKNLLFKDALHEKGDRINLEKYLDRYKKLHEPQENFLFTPDQNKTLKTLLAYRKTQGTGTKLIKSLGRLLGSMTGGALLGETIGTHTGMGALTPALIGMLTGLGGNVSAGRALTEATMHILPKSPKVLMKLLAKYKPGIGSQAVLPGAAVGVGNVMNQGQPDAG